MEGKDRQELVVIHDERLRRTTGLPGRVSERTFDQILEIDAGGACIPSLQMVFDEVATYAQHKRSALSEFTINVELKGPGCAEPLHTFIQRQAKLPRLMFSSFDHQQLFELRALDAHYPIAPLYDKWPSRRRTSWIETAAQLTAVAVNLNWRLCNLERVSAITAAGYDVNAYTVNDPEIAKRLEEMGVSGIFTDRPDLFLS